MDYLLMVLRPSLLVERARKLKDKAWSLKKINFILFSSFVKKIFPKPIFTACKSSSEA